MIETIGDGNPQLVQLGDLTFNVSGSGLEAETCGLIFRFTDVAFTRAWMRSLSS